MQTEALNPAAETRTELLTIEQVSTEYGFAVPTLYGWRHRGIGPASVRLGARVRYRRSDIEAWINQRFSEEERK